MREILFRGKSTEDGKWFTGQLLHFKSPVSEKELDIVIEGCEWDDFNEWFNICRRAKVVPETVGQYTGFTDKNGKKIFEGDIIRKTNEGRYPEIFTANICTDFRVKEEVYYEPLEHFKEIILRDFKSYDYIVGPEHIESFEYEIIGNIHDNPELLKGDTK